MYSYVTSVNSFMSPTKLLITRILGRFALIFYLNCDHVLFVYILKQRRKNFADFQELNFFTKLKTFKTLFLFLSFITLPCDHVMSHKKFEPDRFSRFDVYWIQTNGQTDRQAKFIYRLALEGASRPSSKLIVNMFSLCTS